MIAITLSLTSVSGDEIGRLQVPNAGVTVSDSLDTTTAKATARRTRQVIEHVRVALQSEQFDTTLAPYEFEQRVVEGLLVAGLQGPVDGEVLISLPVLSIPSAPSSSTSTPEATQPDPVAGEPAADSAWDDLFQITETHPEVATDTSLDPPQDMTSSDTFTDLPDQTEGESV